MKASLSILQMILVLGCAQDDGSPGSDGGGSHPTVGQICHAAGTANPGTPPDVKAGVWINVTPPELTQLGVGQYPGGGALALAVDPSNASTVYVGIEETQGSNPHNGIWKTTNCGKDWVRLGTGSDADTQDDVTSYIDLPLAISVDPTDSNHLYVTSGVRGANQGFWDSKDGGATWKRAPFPKGTGNDVTMMAIDPCDYKHILLSPHSDWDLTPSYASGILESTDGGQTWVAHLPPSDAFGSGTKGVFFLHNGETGVGDGNTWLVSGDGYWRTSDAGGHWTKVGDGQSPHGTNEFYYSKKGDLYGGADKALQRSTDNGLTWKAVDGMPGEIYYAVTGDGTNIFTMPDGYPPGAGYLTTADGDGTTWSPYADTTKPRRGPIHLHFDPVNHVVYSVNWDGGIWLLKLT